MNVLFWSEAYPPVIGGAEVWAARFVDGLTRRGHRVLVVTSTEPGDDVLNASAEGPVAIRRFPFWKSLTDHDADSVFGIGALIARLKAGFRPDIVHLSTLGPSLFYHLVTRAAWRAPTLLTLHGSVRQRLPGTFLQRVVTRADWVVGVSHAVLHEASELAPCVRGRSSVIHHGIDLTDGVAGPPPVDRPMLLCLGRFVHEKGFDVAIEAMPEVARHVPGVRLTVAGYGPEENALRARVAELGLDDVVAFVGPIEPADVPALLGRASVVLVPSRSEGFGLTALEAAAQGRPVVASDVGGLPEVVESGRTGILVPPDQPAALAQAVIRLVSDPPRLRALGEAARARVGRSFPWTACVDAYVAQYASIQRRPPPC